MMLRDFKTRLFCRDTGLPRREVDSADSLWVASRTVSPHSFNDPTGYAEFLKGELLDQNVSR